MVCQPPSHPELNGRSVRAHGHILSTSHTNLFSRSDAHDFVLYTLVPHLTFSTPYSYTILTGTILSLLGLLFILPLIPMRLVALCVAWTPFLLLHPFSQTHLPLLLGPHLKKARLRVARLVDDDRLEDRHWRSELRDVELWENERYGEKEKGFSKTSLKSGERKPWTRGRDGWTEEGADGNGGVRSVTLLFFLACKLEFGANWCAAAT